MKRPRLLVVAGLAILVTGCLEDRGPRLPPFPSFDPRQPFTVAVPVDAAATADPLSDAAPSFEDSLMASYASDEATAAAPSVAQEVVPLAGALVGSLPRRGDAWTWSADATATLAVHRTGGRVDALIYAEAWSELVRRFPSAESDRFLRTVAPSLASPTMAVGRSFLDVPIAQIATGAGLSLTAASRAVAALETRTLGRGLGFQPDQDGFHGWRSIGRNGEGVELRLARVEGTWGPQAPVADEVATVLDYLANRSPALAALTATVTDAAAAVTSPREPAFLLVGSATPPSTTGVHLAILCRRPTCSSEADLASFLEDLRPPDLAAATLTASDVQSQAEALGFQLVEMHQRAISAVVQQLAQGPVQE